MVFLQVMLARFMRPLSWACAQRAPVLSSAEDRVLNFLEESHCLHCYSDLIPTLTSLRHSLHTIYRVVSIIVCPFLKNLDKISLKGSLLEVIFDVLNL